MHISSDWAYVAGYALLEFWLGRTKTVKASSVLELALQILSWIVRRRSGMVLINSSIKVSKETDELLQLVAQVVAGLAAKKPIQELLIGLVPAIAKAVDGAELIAAEFRESPTAFCETVGERLGEIVGGLLQVKPS